MSNLTRTRCFAMLLSAALMAAGAGAGCAVDNQSTPSLSGPSEFGLSVTATATPNQLPRDGSSRAVVTLTVRDAQGKGKADLRLALGPISPAGAILSASEVRTDANGSATFTVTAPPASVAGNAISIEVTPAPPDNTSGPSFPRTVSVALTPTNSTVPTPSFIVTPASPEAGQVATLDASATTDEGVACGDTCSYSWDLGGEATRTGRIITYRFQTARIYNVALTVTDAAGASATSRTNVAVAAAAKPTVTFTASPVSPVAGQPATFSATTTVAANHRITSFDWTWGDGRSNQTANPSINHTFTTAGPFVVTVTVTDDLGQTASATNTVTVTGGAVASFTSSPTNPRPGDTVYFNGSASTGGGGTSVVSWTWDFGNGNTSTTTSATTSHVFAAIRTYVVRLTVRDSSGETGTITQNVTVVAP